MLFKSEGKLFVSMGEAGSSINQQGKKRYPHDKAAIVYPAETDHMHKKWFATHNPLGVRVNGINEEWYTTAVRKDEKVQFYLKDWRGVVQEITWGHFHHAIFFRSWEDYRKAVKSFSEEFAKYQSDLDTLVSFPRDSVKRELISKELNAEINGIWQHWKEKFVRWVETQHPENVRLLWAQERLEEARRALESTKEYYISYERILATIELHYATVDSHQILVAANLTQRRNDMETLGRLIKWLKLSIPFPNQEISKPEFNILGGNRTGMASVSMIISFDLFEIEAVTQLRANGFRESLEPILG